MEIDTFEKYFLAKTETLEKQVENLELTVKDKESEIGEYQHREKSFVRLLALLGFSIGSDISGDSKISVGTIYSSWDREKYNEALELIEELELKKTFPEK